MNRRGFLKGLFSAAALIALAPLVEKLCEVVLCEKSYGDLLNEYMPESLIREALEARSSFWDEVITADHSAWRGGKIEIPRMESK
jgi:hypothetical protein